jgi:hypothetical protein
MIRNGAVGIATDYGLDGRSVGFRVPVGVRFLSYVIHTGSEAHPVYQICTGGFSPLV